MAASPVLAAVVSAPPGGHAHQIPPRAMAAFRFHTTSAIPAAAHSLRAGWSLGLRPAKRCHG